MSDITDSDQDVLRGRGPFDCSRLIPGGDDCLEKLFLSVFSIYGHRRAQVRPTFRTWETECQCNVSRYVQRSGLQNG